MLVLDWFLIQAKIIRNCFKQNKKEFLLKDVWHTLIILVGLSLLYIFLISMFDFIHRRNLPTLDFAFIFLSFSLLLFLPLVFYSAVVCSLSFLFEKEEIHFYFSLPVNRLSVFTVKFIQTYFHTIWMVFLGIATFLVALQVYFKITPLIYITGSITFLVFLLIPVCLAVILVIIVSRFIPFVQVKGILAVTGLFVGSLIVAAIRLMQPERLITPEGKMRLFSFVQSLHKPWMTIFPSEWATNILFAYVQKDWPGIYINLFSICMLTLVLIITVYILAHFFYARVWADTVVVSGSSNKKSGWQMALKIFPVSLRVFIQKDLLSFSRDIMEKGSLLILLPLSFVYFYSIYALNHQLQNTAGADKMFSFLYIYLFNFFYSSVVVSGLSGRWIFPSVSLEGNNFRLIKGSPTSLQDFLRAKFLLGFIPVLFIGEILLLGSSFILGLALPWVVVSAIAGVILCLGITLICLLLGMCQADFSIKNPLDLALSYKGFLCLVWECIFVLIMVSLVGVPTALFLYQGFSQYFILSLLFSLSAIFITLKILYLTYKSSLIRLSQKEI